MLAMCLRQGGGGAQPRLMRPRCALRERVRPEVQRSAATTACTHTYCRYSMLIAHARLQQRLGAYAMAAYVRAVGTRAWMTPAPNA